ncbi:helix-turn-helix transcriptional regulator [Mariniluteicoccus flavus]
MARENRAQGGAADDGRARGEGQLVDEQQLIERALARVRAEAGLSVTFIGVVSREQDRLHLNAFAGDVQGALRGLSVGFGTGIGGKAASLRRPMAVENYVGAERISHHYDHVIRAERLQSVLAVPIVVGRRVRAVLYGATRESASLGERTLRLAAEGARELEQQLAVNAALTAQVAHARDIVLGAGPVPVGDHRGAEWEAVREAFARLRVVAATCDDPVLRAELVDLAGTLSDGGQPPPADLRLTAREVDVLSCIAQGQSNAEVAARLALSAETVKSYLRSSMRRLGASSRWEAVVAARRAGLLP